MIAVLFQAPFAVDHPLDDQISRPRILFICSEHTTNPSLPTWSLNTGYSVAPGNSALPRTS